MTKNTKKLFVRSGLALVALMIIGTGLIPLVLNKNLFYLNWWGGLIFAPLAVIVGIFFLYIVIFKYEKVNKMR
jgi:hypothetical protein